MGGINCESCDALGYLESLKLNDFFNLGWQCHRQKVSCRCLVCDIGLFCCLILDKGVGGCVGGGGGGGQRQTKSFHSRQSSIAEETQTNISSRKNTCCGMGNR